MIPVDDSYLHSKAALPDHVYMDAMGFGMGCCCLQLTFQACNIGEARTLYDQLTPLCPIMVILFSLVCSPVKFNPLLVSCQKRPVHFIFIVFREVQQPCDGASMNSSQLCILFCLARCVFFFSFKFKSNLNRQKFYHMRKYLYVLSTLGQM